MSATTLTRRLTTIALATLLLGASARAQLSAHPQLPAGIPPPVSFGADRLEDPVDVAVMSWCHTPTTWAYVADASSNKMVRWVITLSGTAAVPIEWFKWLDGPWGVAVNDLPGHPQQELVYATGRNLSDNPVVQVFDKWGNLLNTFSGNPASNFIDPRGIAVGPQGNVYVVDPARRVIEEFEAGDVVSFSQSTPENIYGLCSNMVPFDVSVDLMRRVHVSGYEFFPFADGQVEVYRYGDSCPTTSLLSPNLIQGIDAKGLCQTRYSWASSLVAELHTLTWGETVWPGYTFPGPAIQTVPTSSAAPIQLGGLEFQRTWRINSLDGLDRVVRCDQRTFVTDRADGEVQIIESKKTSVPRPDGIVAWWKFDEGTGLTAKETLNNRHGTWSAPGVRVTEGVVRCALTFNGGSFGVEVPNHASLEVGLSDFTLEGWIRAEVQTGTITFLDNRSGTGTGYRALLANGMLGFEIDDGTTSHTTISTTPVDDGKWHHVAMVVSRGNATRLYVDSSLVASGTSGAVTGSLSSGASLHLGRSNPSATDGLLGGLDEITLYHQALSITQIAGIEDAECAGKHLPPLAIGATLGTASKVVSY